MGPIRSLAFCAALFAASASLAAPLKVAGRFLQDIHGNNLLLRGVNVPVYKSGFVDDLDAVAAAVGQTQANAVRLEWWANPPGGTIEYTVANFDRAIQKYYDLGIVPIVELHDLTFQYGHDAKTGPNSDGNDRTVFASTITAFWTRSDVVAILVKHQDHLVINLANEWGSSRYSDSSSTATNFIANYTDAIAAMRNAGIVAPLMIDAPKGFEYQFILDNGAALIAADPQHNTMLSVHAYWAASDPAFTDGNVNAIVDAFASSGLPIVLGEASSNAYTAIPCDPIHYGNLLTRANTDSVGYLFWAWYEDGQCGQDMNITVGADGTTLPTAGNPGFGYDALDAAGYGIDAASPATRKADFTPIAPDSADLVLTETATPNPGSTGKDVVFTMVATNNGPATASGVAVNAQYDAAATVVWISPGCTKPGPAALYVCNAGTLAVGASATFKLVLRKATAGSTYDNAGTVSSTTDPNAANNQPTLAVTINASPAASQVLRYRLYSPVTLEHHFTTDLNEYNVLGGNGNWNQEGTVGHVLDNPGSFSGVAATPYYRLYNTTTQWHHWTTDPNEYYTLIQFPNWNAEGVDGYILPSNTVGATQLYRLLYPFIPGLHHWTIDPNEYSALISQYGWIGEGGSGFVIQ